MIDANRILQFDPGELDASYDAQACMRYALSIGIGMQPTDALELAFVFERGLLAFPTMPSVLGWPGRLTDPAYGIDHRMVVASDLDVELLRPLQTAEQLTTRPRVAHVIDRGAGEAAIIGFERTLRTADGTAVAIVRNHIIARGQGGFGGSPEGLERPHALPDLPPDRNCDLRTPPNLALLFRLHGDTNPIHVDPVLASKAGFPAPLLHGAASFGVAAYALVRTVLGGDPRRFRRLRARFGKPFFPGETLRTEMWLRGDEVSFRCLSVERGDVTLANGLLQLHPATT